MVKAGNCLFLEKKFEIQSVRSYDAFETGGRGLHLNKEAGRNFKRKVRLKNVQHMRVATYDRTVVL